MQITTTARHFDLTRAIRDHVEKACEKLDKYFDQIINIHITLDLENGRNIVEMALHAAHFNLVSEAEEFDMYLAIDSAIEKMESQIKKLKDKVTHHQKKVSKEDRVYAYANLVERGQDKPRRVVKTKRVVAEPMSLNEAMEKFDTLSDPYLIFMNVETDRINVLVKKDESHFKLLEP